MSAGTHIGKIAVPDAHFNSSTERMIMVILDNDLANVIQAERRVRAARERFRNESLGTARDPASRLSISRLGAAWLYSQITGPLPVFRPLRRRNPSSAETI